MRAACPRLKSFFFFFLISVFPLEMIPVVAEAGIPCLVNLPANLTRVCLCRSSLCSQTNLKLMEWCESPYQL